MANRSNPRRSRKRRSAGGAPGGRTHAGAEATADAALANRSEGSAARSPAAKGSTAKTSAARERARRGESPNPSPARSLGERPQALWHPLPLSEILILVGAIATVIGLRRGVSHGGAPLFVGLAAVAVGTIEVTLREHLSGFRSHTLILALLPVIVLHSLIVLGVAAFTPVPRLLTVGLLVLDVGLVFLFFRLFRARFLDARRQRTLGRR